VDTALVFNRWGNSNAQSNFLGHRMLDDVTGILFVLGFFHGIFRIREKKFFYAISGICVMSLPSILSINGGHGGRMLGVTPFAAYLCSLFINEWCARWDFFFQNKKGLKIFSRGLGLGLLGAVVFLNFYAYFFQQTANPDYMNDFSWPETKVGQAVAGADDKTEFFLASRFYGHPTVEYLGYSRRNRTHPLNLNDPPRVGDYPKGESFCFFLDELKMGALDFLNHLYPGGKTGSSTIRWERRRFAPIGFPRTLWPMEGWAFPWSKRAFTVFTAIGNREAKNHFWKDGTPSLISLSGTCPRLPRPFLSTGAAVSRRRSRVPINSW
jgi:hypothetical protein